MSSLIAKDLRKTYPTPDGELVIFNRLSVELGDGEALAIVGPSGCGKSTLLHCLGTLDPPTSGTVFVDNVNPYALSANELAAFRNEKIGFVFQDHFLLPQLSALQNTLIPALANGSATSTILERARELLEKVGLAHRAGHLPSELSGGEKARVAIARALLMRPRIVLADEPTGSLDPATANVISDLLLDLQRQEQVSLAVVTHSTELAERFAKQLRLA